MLILVERLKWIDDGLGKVTLFCKVIRELLKTVFPKEVLFFMSSMRKTTWSTGLSPLVEPDWVNI